MAVARADSIFMVDLMYPLSTGTPSVSFALHKRGLLRARHSRPHRRRDIMRPLMMAEFDENAKPLTSRRQRIDTRACDALELLMAASPSCPEPLLLVHGIKTEIIAGLVSKGLATVHTEMPNAGGCSVEVVRIKITDAGRRALKARSMLRPMKAPPWPTVSPQPPPPDRSGRHQKSAIAHEVAIERGVKPD
jgi:hypothetical protein